MSILKKYINIIRHLKLEIALAIPASNDEKYNTTNSAGQGLNCDAGHTKLGLTNFLGGGLAPRQAPTEPYLHLVPFQIP